MQRPKRVVAISLGALLALSASTPAGAYCETVCSLAKEGVCVEQRTTCPNLGPGPAPRSLTGPSSETFGHADAAIFVRPMSLGCS
jgi:hypothetical protein